MYELTSPARKSPQRRAEATAKASSFRREFEWSAQDTREAERIVKQAMAQAKREQERVWVEQKRAFEEQKRALTEAKQALREAARERAQDFSEAYRDLDEAYRELFEVELPKGELRRIAKELDKARDQLAAEETAFADTLMKTLERLESQISAMADGADH